MTFELVIAEDAFDDLRRHLFRPDADEHAAVVLAGIYTTEKATRLLVRELHLVPRESFTPGTYGYRQVTPRYIAELATRAADEELSFVSIHSHPGADRSVALSADDRAAHARLFPHLLDLIHRRPVVGVAMGAESAAGEVWSYGQEPAALHAMNVVGTSTRRLLSRPHTGLATSVERLDRQVRMFGFSGQLILSKLKIAVAGAGGGGSMLIEQLAHLGVGAITVADYDVVKTVNLSRIVGSTAADLGRKKVDVLGRLVRSVDPYCEYRGIDGDLTDLDVAAEFLDSDFIFLATDTIASRLVFNAIVHRYLIPGIQIGAKIEVSPSGQVDQIYVAVRPVFPSRGCLQCNSLIDPMRLQVERRTDEEMRAQNYVDEPEVIDPSVISLNGIAASHAVNTMLFAFTGLAYPGLLDHKLFFPQAGDVLTVQPRKDLNCLFCGGESGSHYARGGGADALPVRLAQKARRGQDGRSDGSRLKTRLRRLDGILRRWTTYQSRPP